jgi:hypothetical protein
LGFFTDTPGPLPHPSEPPDPGSGPVMSCVPHSYRSFFQYLASGQILVRSSRRMARYWFAVCAGKLVHRSANAKLSLFCIRDFHVRCSRTHPHSWERTVSVCIIHLCSVFARPPHPFLSHLANKRHHHHSCVFLFLSYLHPMCTLFGGILVSCYFFSSSRTVSLILTLLPPARQKWRN